MRMIASVLCFLLLAACGSVNGPTPFQGAADPALLKGGVWTLVQVADGPRDALAPRAGLTVQFGPNGRFGGTADPNSYGGEYEAHSTGEIRMEPPVSTLIGGSQAERSGAYLWRMVRATRYEATATELRLHSPDGGYLHFRREAATR